MLNYLRESLHWLNLVFCKPVTCKEELERLTKAEKFKLYIKVFPIGLAIILVLEIAIGVLFKFVGVRFDLAFAWFVATQLALICGSAVAAIFGLVNGIIFGLSVGLVSGLLGGAGRLVLGAGFGLAGKQGVALAMGMLLGLIFGPVFVLANRLRAGLGWGLFFGAGLGGGLVDFLWVSGGYCTAFGTIVLLNYNRPFYLPPYFIQYWRALNASDPFRLIHNSPVYWDEVIATPLPYLKDWLVSLVKRDRKRGLEEILFVAEKRPYQRNAAFKALLTVVEQDLQRINDLYGLANVGDLLKAFPAESKYLPEGWNDTRRSLNTISTLANDYQLRLTPSGQLRVLGELREEVRYFQKQMALTVGAVSTTFQPLATRWLEIAKQAEIEARTHLQFTALPNPYVASVPLQPRDFGLLKGRRDIIRAIEKDILNTGQRPSLLLYGRRRTGKSSTLLNLPLLLSSQFESVYIDCQDAKWHESDQAFCYNLARDIFDRLFQSDSIKGTDEPQLDQFEKNAFTRLDQYLDQFEQLTAQRNKRILLAFDEYEGLEESITGGDISKNVLGKLRNIIQHREQIVVLVSGSHRFEELTGVNWASYLINTRTLELSFLEEPSARELLTEPVPQLRYEDGVLEEILRLTHCQPYLLQAVASELVNHLNELQKTTAERADLDAAVNKALTSAGAYFSYTWGTDSSATEQTALRAYAEGAGERVAAAEFQAALQSLIRKEMMERDGDAYRLAVPLFGLWILRNQAD